MTKQHSIEWAKLFLNVMISLMSYSTTSKAQ